MHTLSATDEGRDEADELAAPLLADSELDAAPLESDLPSMS